MRIMKTKSGNLFLETSSHVESVFDGKSYTYFVPLPSLEELARLMPTPLLEDIFETARMELQCRDKQWIEENL